MAENILDLSPEQVIRWLQREIEAEPSRVIWRATVEYTSEDAAEVAASDPEDDAGVHAVSKTGIVEINPVDANEGWTLRVQITDDIGEHLPEGRSAPLQPESLDLDSYHEEFLRSGSVVGDVTVIAASERAEAFANRIISDIVNDRHAA